MSASHATFDPAVVPHAPARPQRRRHLFGPFVDWFCLGGSSLIYVPLLFLRPADDYRFALATGMMLLANAINHPHFAHSYQIFYRNFRAKISGPDYAQDLRLRYVAAGIVAPVLLATFFAACVMSGDRRVLGLAGNLMAFVVGWHYVKQGYGMLMVDAALKRRFFSAGEKKMLLVNSYAVWLFSWLAINFVASERSLWGLDYFSIAVPMPILVLSGAVVACTTGLTAAMLAHRWWNGASLPANGLVAYLASLYMWLLLVRLDPLWFLVVPVLHSLQYLVVVWRFEANYQKGQPCDGARTPPLLRRLFGTADRARVASFIAKGGILGFVGLWGLPIALDLVIPYDKAAFGDTMFLFIFWIFINVHHYLMDNVMWRRENPEAQKYLFA